MEDSNKEIILTKGNLYIPDVIAGIGIMIVLLLCLNQVNWIFSKTIIMLLCIIHPFIVITRTGFQTQTLIFNHEGCEISFLCFKKIYKWDELKTIKYEYYCQYKNENGRIRSLPTYKSCIIFSNEKLSKKEWRAPDIERELKAFYKPFSIFYVNFLPKNLPINKMHDTNFVVDEHKFINKLNEWGIKVEDLDKPKPKAWDLKL